MKETTIVLYPSPGIGHLVSMVELGKLILKHYPSFSVSIIITPVPFDTGSTTPYITAVSSTTPSITFHHLPAISPPPSIPITLSNIPHLNFEIPRLNNPNLHKLLVSLSSKQQVMIKAFIIDFFCSASVQVTKELDIPTYFFFTSGGYGLAGFLYLPVTHKRVEGFKEQDSSGADYFDIPGLPLLHRSDLSSEQVDSECAIYKLFEQTARTMQDCSGIIINTFLVFEETGINAIKGGKCVPDGRTPPIFTIGPLISTSNNKDEKHDCLSWLDSQPSQSVVFLCFGSIGVFSKEQLKEIAVGLDKSGVRFLWVVRIPPSNEPAADTINSVVPAGFIERTRNKGLVVKDWVPQAAVLSHGSVGGFVTHCGWNSALEAVSFGVPMLAWPLYAEQKLLRVILVEAIKIAIKINMSDIGFVTASELEERVRELMMNSGKGQEVRDRVTMFRDAAVVAMGDGGSSRNDLSKFVDSLKTH